VVGEGFHDSSGVRRGERQLKQLLGVGRVEILAAEAVDTRQDLGVVLRVDLDRGAHLKR
jgi:hypothetical protein